VSLFMAPARSKIGAPRRCGNFSERAGLGAHMSAQNVDWSGSVFPVGGNVPGTPCRPWLARKMLWSVVP
jgi:hypothetical protein